MLPEAVVAGFLDEVVDADALDARALAVAEQLMQLPQKQYAANKLFARKNALGDMQAALETMLTPGD